MQQSAGTSAGAVEKRRMADSNQVRINELARELEIKAKVLIDYLPEAGVTEKKTHSSSIDLKHAELVRKHFRGLAAAEEAEEAAKVAKATAAKKPAAKPVAAAPAAAPAAAGAKPAAGAVATGAPATTAGRPGVAAHAPATGPATAPGAARPAAPAGTTATHPTTPTHPTGPAPAAARPAAAAPAAPASTTGTRPGVAPAPSAPRPGVPLRPAAAPGSAPAGARPAGTVPGAPRPAGAPSSTLQRYPVRPGGPGGAPGQSRPGAPQGMRPAGGAPQQYRPSSAPQGRPGGAPGQRPGGPPSRFPQRPGSGGGPGGRDNKGPVGTQRPGAGVPKAEPGKPLYARKPAARGRPLIEKRYAEGERKLHPVRPRAGAGPGGRATAVEPVAPVKREPRALTVTEGITVRELAEKLDIRAKDLLKTLLDRGVFASINQALDVPTATNLAEAFNGVVQVVTFEEQLVQEEKVKEERTGNEVPRAPVVTVMGHVDHGKTSLLDAIREADVAGGEAGGITQHIGAYKVVVNDRSVVFVDTPGHEAFTRMRSRGAKVTDIVVLVVAADDGVMPQTKEAIDHAKAAKVPIIVAINKIDKPEAQVERVKRQLSDVNLVPAEWGGDTEFVEVSAKQKKGIDKLLETILLVADLRELKANPDAPASGTVLESRVDKGRGPVATVLVQNGTLNSGDFFICGSVFGKVRAMFDDRGRTIKDAPPSTPVEVLGLQGVPDAGDHFQVTEEAKARHIVEYRQGKQRDAQMARSSGARITLDQLHEQLKAGDVKELGIVIKADVQGSVEVLSEMLPKLSTDQVKLKIIGSGVGAVTENDVLLASASGAIVIAFGIRPDRKAMELAQQEHVDIRSHTIIYEVSDELKKAMEGLLEPVIQETYLGRAEVRNTFKVKGSGTVAGCYVVDGVLKRDAQIRVVRDGAVIYTSKLSSLKRFKDDASEVRTGFECGAGIANFNDVKVGDILECFSVTKLSAAEAAGQTVGTAGRR